MACEHGYAEGIRFLKIEDIVKINESVLAITPKEMKGVKSQAILESSQQSPSCHRYYEQTEDIFTLAAVLGWSLARNHAFHNGNKRTAAECVSAFLILNGYDLVADDDEIVKMYVGIVCDSYSRLEFADWLAYRSTTFDTRGLN